MIKPRIENNLRNTTVQAICWLIILLIAISTFRTKSKQEERFEAPIIEHSEISDER